MRMGLASHETFITVAVVVATELVPEGRKASALASLAVGLTLATVIALA